MQPPTMKGFLGWRPPGGARTVAAGRLPRRGLLALRAVIAVIAVIAVLAARPAWADGTQTGLITGQVVDASGAGVAAVQVTAVGPQIRRTEVADDQGRFRFPALGVGTYDLHAELLGLAADQRGVGVSIGRTTIVQLRLGGPAQPPGTAAGSASSPPATGVAAGGEADLAAQESIQG